jgi:uncharacterized lipoprotein YmbA
MFKINFIIMLFLTILITCCTSVKIENGFEIKTEREGRIKVHGIALNAKGGCMVLTKNDSVYYVGNNKQWAEKFLNKKIVVSGMLVITTYTKLDSTRIVQEIKRKPQIKRAIYKLQNEID